MGLKNIIESYKIIDKAMNFMHRLKKRHITRSDLESGSYPELNDLFNELDTQGKSQMKEHPVSTVIGAVCYTLLHPGETISGQKYYRSGFGGACSIR